MLYRYISKTEAATMLRDDEFAGWSADAAWALAEYYADLGEEMEIGPFSVVDVRCEWSELTDEELSYQWGDGEKTRGEIIEELSEKTSILPLDNGSTLVLEFETAKHDWYAQFED